MMSGTLLAGLYWEVEHVKQHQAWTTWREELESEFEYEVDGDGRRLSCHVCNSLFVLPGRIVPAPVSTASTAA